MAGRGVAAFSLQPVATGLGRQVRGLCPWGDKLLVGLADGKLVLFAPDDDALEPSPSGADAPRAFQAQRTVSLFRGAFGAGGTGQLEAWARKDLAFAITSEGVNLYDLPAFHLRAQASGSRGAAAFAWDEGTGMLAVATKRRLQLYHYDGKELIELRSFGIADAVTAAWCGDSLCVGTKKQYLFLNPNTGAVAEGALVGKAAKPCAVRTASDEVMVFTDSACLFLGPHGRQLHKPLLTWRAPPVAAAYSSPYVIAALPDGIVEIRNAGRTGGGTVQILKGEQGVAIAPSGPGSDRSLLFALGNDLVRLAPAPWPAQARALARQGEFQDALELCACINDPVERATMQDQLRIRYGRMLCAGGEYGLGLAQFGMCKNKDPLVLLALFPSLVPASMLADLPTSIDDVLEGGDARLEVAEPEGDDMIEVLYTLLQYLYSHRSRLAAIAGEVAPKTPVAADSCATPAEGSPAGAEGSEAGTRSNESDSEGDAVSTSAAESDDEPFPLKQQSGPEALSENASGVEASAFAAEASGKKEGSAKGGSAKGTPKADDAEGSSGLMDDALRKTSLDVDCTLRALPDAARARLAVVVDTVMCKVLLRLPDRGELLRFLQQPNAVDLYEGEACLQEAGMYAELCALYRTHERHSRAMTLLQRLSQSPEVLTPAPRGAASELGGRTGVWAALRYIVGMGAGEINLIKQHSRWILKADPEAAVEALLSMDPPLAPELMQQILQASVPHMVATYLEAALEAGIASPEVAHPELVRIYLKQAAAAEKRLGPIFKRRRSRRPDLSGDATKPRSGMQRAARDWSKLFPAGSVLRSHTQFSQARLTQESQSGGDNRSDGTAGGESSIAAGEELSREDIEGIEAHEKLVQLVCLSPHIDARDLLRQLSRHTLTEIRALLLERIADHRGALHSYVYELHDAQLAEAYCDRVYEAVKSGKLESDALRGLYNQADVCHPGDIYLALLAAYLQGPGLDAKVAAVGGPASGQANRSAPSWDQLASLLSRKVPRMDAGPALELLSLHASDVPLQALLPFLQALLRHRMQQARLGAVEMHLRRSEHLTGLEELDTVRRSYVLLTPMRACSICHKRIGTSVFVRQPDASLLHYSCYRRHTCQYTQLGTVPETA